MFKTVYSSVAWAFRLGARFMQAAPVQTVFSVVTGSFIQLSVLIASFLPIQLVVILGGGQASRRFVPPQFANLSNEHLIGGIAALSVLFLFVNVVLNRSVDGQLERGAIKVVDDNDKFMVFENQNEIAINAYRKFTDGISGLVFAILAFCILLFLERALVFGLLLFFVFSLFVILIASSISSTLFRFLNKDIAPILTLLSHCGLFVAIGILIFQFLYSTPPTFITALVSIILIRLLLMRLSNFITNIFLLKKQKEQIDVIFFKNQKHEVDKNLANSDIWQLLQADSQQVWMSSLLEELGFDKGSSFSSRWLQSNIVNLLLFELKVDGESNVFIVKIFDKNKTTSAQHESLLVLEGLPLLPSPTLACCTIINGYQVHVYKLNEKERLTSQGLPKIDRLLRAQLMGVEPDKLLVERYSRTRSTLPDRLGESMLVRLRLVSTPVECKLLDNIESRLPEIRRILRSLPLVLQTAGYSKSLIVDSTDGLKCLHWSDWKLEPLGFGWGITGKWQSELSEVVEAAVEARPNLQDYPIEKYLLCVVACAFEQDVNAQRFHEALVKAEKLLEISDNL